MKLKNCSKKYKDKTVFEHVTLTLDSGIYHLTGANGSGKSVLCRCLLGLEQLTEGEIENRPERVIFLPDTPLGEDWLSMQENIDLLLFYYGITLAEDEKYELISRLRITQPDQNYHQVSVGTAMKIGLFFLLLKERWDMIVLDETLAHMDAAFREMIWDELELRAQEGAVVILIDHSFEKRDKDQWKTLVMEDINGRN